MKKILILFLTFFILNSSYAFTPSSSDIKAINTINERLWDISHTKGEKWFLNTIERFEKIIPKFEENERINYALSKVLDELKTITNTYWPENTKNVSSSNSLNSEYKQFIKNFFEKHGNEITTPLEVDERCTKYFDFVDEIAKDNDFPTELILANWWIESNCNLYNPGNGRGPFQIIGDWQEPGDISLDEFKADVEQFIAFSKNKWKYFNTNTYVNYKTRFGNENINISYQNYTIRELKLHGILYNGISSDTTLDGNSFVNFNLYPERTGNYDGLVTRFLKILNWRIENNI